MSKTKRFEIFTDEPRGPTFDEDGKGSGIYNRLGGEKNTKKKARFGINADEPDGDTFDGHPPHGSHINFPKADSGPVLLNKVVAASSGQGEYEPDTNALPNATDLAHGSGGGSNPVGKSSPKHGKGMKPMSKWLRGAG
ncbi:MAG: hypothetical protein ACHQ9S_18815 [Candidatus Binatia bacterium]